MEIKNVKKALIDQMNLNLSGNLYHKTQIEFAYHNNCIEGSSITKDETTSIYDTDTIIINSEKVLVIKDVIETKNHFTLFKYMLETIDDNLSEELIKQYHSILKNGTLTKDEKKWFQVGEYKTLKNFVGDITTSLPNNVSKDMKELLNWYNYIPKKTFEDIIEYHVRFEKIHPFQDGNGRIGRIIMFKECLKNEIMPFIIEDRNKAFYIRGLKEYQLHNEKEYLIDTCLNSQDNYTKLVEFFLE